MWHQTSRVILASCMLLCAAVACDQSKPDVSPVAQSPSGNQGEPRALDSAEVDAGVKLEDGSLDGQMARSKGKACVIDEGCAGYLRCIERACTVPPAISGEHDATTPEVVFREGREAKGSPERARFFVELATDNAQRQRGLMYRRAMKPDWGMIFIYPQDRPLSFWMKNTYIALDMVFINAAGEVVGVLEDVEPLTLEPRTVPHPSRYVLELGAGVAREHGIEQGLWMDILKLEHEAQRPLP